MITIGAIYAYWDGYVDDNNYINYVFRPLWAIQVILDRFGQFGPFLATFNHFVPQIWSPNIALNSVSNFFWIPSLSRNILAVQSWPTNTERARETSSSRLTLSSPNDDCGGGGNDDDVNDAYM